MKDYTGKRFGKLVCLKRIKDNKITKYVCHCDCGNEKTVESGHLVAGSTNSCGCLRKGINKTHGMTNTRPYHIWRGLSARCNNKNNKDYHKYGGRGITVSQKWNTFSGFWEEMKSGYAENLQIDRINNNGDYCKENCRWVSNKINSRNTRANVFISFNGKSACLQEWSEITGILRETLADRIKRGWSIKDTLTIKPNLSNKNKKIWKYVS